MIKTLILTLLLLVGVSPQYPFPADALKNVLRGKPELFVYIKEGLARREIKTRIHVLIKGDLLYFGGGYASLGICVNGGKNSICETKPIPVGMLRYYSITVPPFRSLSIERRQVALVVAVFRIKRFNPLTGEPVLHEEPLVEYKKVLPVHSLSV